MCKYFCDLRSAIILVVLFESLFAVKVHRSECRRDSLYKASDRDKILTLAAGNIIVATTAVALSTCAKQCTSHSQGRSFNFQKDGSNNCKILDIDKKNATAKIESAPGWIHYEPVDQVGPRCRFINCLAGYRCIETCSTSVGFDCVDINECNSSPCQNGATCNNLVNKYTCTCVAGYTGTNCETDINECSSNPCQNGGACNDLVNKYTCTCAAGYQGINCETDINECSSTPCLNGAGCNNLVNKYTCTCTAGYDGTHCATNINECSSSPCNNGGTCNDLVNGYSCSCTTGYGGTHCETDTSCRPYSMLNEADRAMSFFDGSAICDSGLATGWYRFGSPAGTQMITSPVPNYGTEYRCKTHAGGWLNGAHPTTADGEVERQVCFAYAGNTCYGKTTIKVLNCGSYYIYYLTAPSGCSYRYCGNH